MFGFKQSLVVPYTLNEDAAAAAEHCFDGPFYEGHYDFVMKDDASVLDAEEAYSQRASMSSKPRHTHLPTPTRSAPP